MQELVILKNLKVLDSEHIEFPANIFGFYFVKIPYINLQLEKNSILFGILYATLFLTHFCISQSILYTLYNNKQTQNKVVYLLM